MVRQHSLADGFKDIRSRLVTGNRHSNRLLLVFFSIFLIALSSCSLSPDAAKRKYLQKADKLYAAGNYAEAALNYQKAIQKDGRFGEAHYGLALVQLKLLKTREAYESTSRAAEMLPNREDVKVRLADLGLLLYLSDPKHPANLYRQVTQLSDGMLSKNPNSFDGLRIKGQLAMADKKTGDAVDLFRRANAIKPMQPEVILALARALEKLGQYSDAEKVALELIQSDKSFGPIYDLLYKEYLVKNRFADAEKILKARADNNPKVASYSIQLAAHYAAFGKRAEMNATLQRVKALDNTHLVLGDFYSNLGDLQEARREFEGGAKAFPKDAAVYQKRIANLLIAEGKKGEAEQLLDKLVAADPTDRAAESVRAGLLMNSGNAEKLSAAAAEFADLVKNKPEDPVAHYNLGRALLAQGDLDSARGQFLQAIERKRDYLPPRFYLVEVCLQTNRNDDALRYATEILAFQRDNVRARLQHAAAQSNRGKLTEARQELTALLKDQPQFVDAELELGFLDLKENLPTEANEIFKKHYKAGSADLRPLEGLVDCLGLLRKFDEAAKLLADESKLSPNSVPLQSFVAANAAKLGKLDMAIGQYQQLATSNPTVAEFQVHLGEIYFRKGDLKNAVESLRKARALAPKNPIVTTMLATMLEAAGRNEEAVASYRETLQLQPENAIVLNNLAFLLADGGKNLEEASKLAEKAQKRMPGHPVISDTMGWIYLKKGMSQSAMHVFANLARKYPDNPTFHYHYGLSLIVNGEKKKAQGEFRLALAHGPSRLEESRIKDLVTSAK
jgi:tetratricopeptide (TPR) repeat protein